MIKLSIITINYNDASGLKKTLDSVAAQSYANIQHVIIDGGSPDNSKDVIIEYAEKTKNPQHDVLWISEPDKGIYNAMNKGIKMATGEYIQILNSGDLLVGADVTERMFTAMHQVKTQQHQQQDINNDSVAEQHITSHLSPLTSNLYPTVLFLLRLRDCLCISPVTDLA